VTELRGRVLAECCQNLSQRLPRSALWNIYWSRQWRADFSANYAIGGRAKTSGSCVTRYGRAQRNKISTKIQLADADDLEAETILYAPIDRCTAGIRQRRIQETRVSW
jgi:hypothetical protein